MESITKFLIITHKLCFSYPFFIGKILPIFFIIKKEGILEGFYPTSEGEKKVKIILFLNTWFLACSHECKS
jgi:hypothetical protein